MNDKTFLFLDIETTGLVPGDDKILEIAWAVTDSEFNEIYNRRFLIDQVDEDGWEAVWSCLNSNQVVSRMHSKTGLLAELANDDVTKTSLDEVYETLDRDVRRESLHGTVHLTGRSVHFDKSFLLAENFGGIFNDTMPGTIHHRMLDLTSVKLMLEAAGVNFDSFQPESMYQQHRALNDVKNDIALAAAVRTKIEEVFA